MSVKAVSKYLLITVLAVSVSGCLTRRTVKQDGRVVDSHYRFKRPLKEAVKNSQ